MPNLTTETLNALEHDALNVLAAASYEIARIPTGDIGTVLVFADAAIIAEHPLASMFTGEWMTELLARSRA